MHGIPSPCERRRLLDHINTGAVAAAVCWGLVPEGSSNLDRKWISSFPVVNSDDV